MVLTAEGTVPPYTPVGSSSAHNGGTADGAGAASSSTQRDKRMTRREGSQLGDPVTVEPAGPSVFEQKARQDQHTGQISVGPSTFEQQIRSQMPSPAPIPITRGPWPH
jgi:hypothetical protein